ncbi:MAG: RNA polymerase sigma factor [Bacteroidota bacterium]
MAEKLNISDSSLIERIKQGGSACDQAMKWIYRQHVDQIVQFIVSRNGSQDEAKDIFQDAMINLMLSIQQEKFKGNSSLRTYLYAISKNLWYRRFNRSLREDAYKMEQSGAEDLAESPDVLLMETEKQQALHQMMDQLKVKCKEVLLLWARKFSMKEIAEKLGYQNEQVVRNKKNLCLKELKSLVQENPQVRNMIGELVKDE